MKKLLLSISYELHKKLMANAKKHENTLTQEIRETLAKGLNAKH